MENEAINTRESEYAPRTSPNIILLMCLHLMIFLSSRVYAPWGFFYNEPSCLLPLHIFLKASLKKLRKVDHN